MTRNPNPGICVDWLSPTPKIDPASFCIGKPIPWDVVAFKLTLSLEYRNTIRDEILPPPCSHTCSSSLAGN